jgi:hypothetical protein
MKPAYKSWEDLKIDAAIEKSTDITRDKGVASVFFKDNETPLVYKRVDDGWVLQVPPKPPHRLVTRFK